MSITKWHDRLLSLRRKLKIYARGHCFKDKMRPASIDFDSVVDVVKTGSLVVEKCEQPDKLVFKKGRLFVVCRFRIDHIKVVTVYIDKK